MKRLLSLWRDEHGVVLSAEAALLGTLGVLGAVVGVNLFAGAVNDELRDVAYSFRSLDQSYSVAGHSSPTAWTAGSGFTQEPVEKSLARLRVEEKELIARQRAREEQRQKEVEKARDGARDDERRADDRRDDERRDDDRRRDENRDQRRKNRSDD